MPVFPAVTGQPLTRREAREARAAEQTRDGAASGNEAAGSGTDQRNPRAPGPQSPARSASFPGLDFDTVITGPVATSGGGNAEGFAPGQREPAPAPLRHSSDYFAAEKDEYGDHPLPQAGREEADPDEQPLGWWQQNSLSREEPKRRRRWARRLVVFVVIVAVLGGMAAGAYVFFQPQVERVIAAILPKDDDYKGNGAGQVMFTIKSGDTGDTIAANLHKAGVTKSNDAFYTLLLRQKPEPQFQPGVFKLAKRMSALAALIALQDPASRVPTSVVIPEGTAEADVLKAVSEKTGIPLAQLQQAAAAPSDFGLPAEAKTLEGFLFPATYTFAPGASAHDAIKMMVDRMFQSLDAAKVAQADRWKTIVLASIVQREAGLKDDYPKVARVFLNRLAQGWDFQSDATVAYGNGNTHRVETTAAERADAGNPYNTYVHPGLPVGPISNPGDLAINAVMHPADGPWMFFVTWNLQTGETIFSTTAAEHDAAVAKWQQWMKDNPGYE
ncbi:hypothetical protein ATY41_02030 [Leifsonia xyli subsp. xyli]|uniref:Endolytic murein transglycosylase n=1 Tax=Leifsonia xyli subsp. xyli TaxID=59736 RepID=A0A1E2SKW8_LEIXY|nr:hypothetical protein ATY41_02030 [Leifsonia xyli subsp. xyli]